VRVSPGCRSAIAWLSLAVSVAATFGVLVIPLNRYNWDGRSAMTPDPDDVFGIVIFSLAGIAGALAAVWAVRREAGRVRASVMTIAAIVAVYDVVRLLQAIPHYRG
jgi:hypothetical protein